MSSFSLNRAKILSTELWQKNGLNNCGQLFNQVFSCYDINALAREDPRGDLIGTPSVFLQSKLLNIK